MNYDSLTRKLWCQCYSAKTTRSAPIVEPVEFITFFSQQENTPWGGQSDISVRNCQKGFAIDLGFGWMILDTVQENRYLLWIGCSQEAETVL